MAWPRMNISSSSLKRQRWAESLRPAVIWPTTMARGKSRRAVPFGPSWPRQSHGDETGMRSSGLNGGLYPNGPTSLATRISEFLPVVPQQVVRAHKQVREVFLRRSLQGGLQCDGALPDRHPHRNPFLHPATGAGKNLEGDDWMNYEHTNIIVNPDGRFFLHQRVKFQRR